MKKLSKEEIIDIIYGCTVLGTGGGGNLQNGIAMMQKDFDQGRELNMVDLSQLPDEALIATPYGCGAPAAEDAEEKEEFRKLPHLEDSAAILAFKSLEEFVGKKFFAVSSTELGGENTAEALHIACQLGLPIVDADPAGRSVPELQHSTYYVKGLPIHPLAVATNFGEQIIIKDVCGDLRAESIVRAIAVASGNDVGVADHPMTGKTYKSSVIPGAITYAMNIGKTLRESKEAGKDVALSIAESAEGKLVFRGVVSKAPWEDAGGFNIGDIYLKGIKEFTGNEYRLNFKNENMAGFFNGKLDVCIPDLICMIDDNGDPITIPNFEEGMVMNVVGLPAPEIWTTERGLDVFGPRTMGFDFDYKPFLR